MYGYRGKIGILVPSINTTMEMDFHKMAPEGISVHTARISWDAPESSVESLREMTDKAVKAAKDVAAAHVDVIVYGHAHKAANHMREGVLLFNPGTVAGYTPSGVHSVGVLEVGDAISGDIIEII